MKTQLIAALLGTTLAAAQVPTEGKYTLTSIQFEAIGANCLINDNIKWRFLLVDQPTDRESPEYVRYMESKFAAINYRINLERPRAASTFFGNAPCGGLGPQLYCNSGLYFTPASGNGLFL